MEPQTVPSSPAPETKLHNPPLNHPAKKLLLVILGTAVLAGSTLLGIQIGQSKKIDTQPVADSTPTTISADPTPSPTDIDNNLNTSSDWRTAKFGGLFSYEYPAGWHVAELWQENRIVIAIDPEPINTAPRGGPLSTFEITVINGQPNPDEILADHISRFNSTNYSNITQEKISAPIGDIYHFKGNVVGEMYNGEPVENYYFTFKGNPNDRYNQQVIIATLTFNDDPQLSETLRHIVTSFKQLTP